VDSVCCQVPASISYISIEEEKNEEKEKKKENWILKNSFL
jgi:hypothetical protein